MDKDVLWSIYIKKNPNFLTVGVNFSPAGLKKFFETTWDSGHKQGVVNGKTIASKDSRSSNSSYDPVEQLLKIFGMK